MKIEFELNEAQEKTLKEIMELPKLKGKDANEVCKGTFIHAIIQEKQQMVAEELSR